MATVPDYPILGAPTIGLGAFTNILVNAGSPAAPEAASIYAAATSRGVDPGILLAVFQHESNFGKAGIAVGRDNGFGLRYYGADAYGGTNKGGWYSFPSWTAGAQHVAALLAGSSYGQSADYSTARSFPFRYAPSADHNNPTAYGASVAQSIYKWSGGAAGVTPKLPNNPPAGTGKDTLPAAPASSVTKPITAAGTVAHRGPSSSTYALVLAALGLVVLAIIAGSL